MRFLIDEDVPVKIIPWLKKLGHDAKRVPSGTKNGAVRRLAIQEARILITRDADFTDTALHPPAQCSGIIHLGFHPPYWEDIAPPLGRLLAGATPERFAGRLIALRADGYDEFQ